MSRLRAGLILSRPTPPEEARSFECTKAIWNELRYDSIVVSALIIQASNRVHYPELYNII